MRIKRHYIPPLFLAAAGAAAMAGAPLADPSDLVRVSSADQSPEADGSRTGGEEAAPTAAWRADSDVRLGTNLG
jgi:hypothetical protein